MRITASLFALAGVFAIGCGETPTDTCESTRNCLTGMSCVDRRCVSNPDSGSVDGGAAAMVDAPRVPIDAWTFPDNGLVPDGDIDTEHPDMLAAVRIEPPFDQSYTAYDLGPIPGTPADTRYGGCVISREDPNLLLVGVDSELATGSIYSVRVRRSRTGHILGYDGVATQVMSVPYIDANLFYDGAGNLLTTAWNVNQLHIIRPGATTVSQTIDLAALGVDSSPGGGAFVPQGFDTTGELRVVGWPSHRWHELTYTYGSDGTYSFSMNAVPRSALSVGSGGFAYVPTGSPQVERPSVVVAEWAASISFFEVDARGNPLPDSRRPFVTGLTRAWGAYFEPVTGDFIFPSWGLEQVIIIQGFRPPPPPPDPIVL